MAVLLASCGTAGTGSVRTESREVRGFSSVQLTGSGEATIQQTGAESLAIEAEENLLPLLTSEVSNGVLTLGTKPGASINPTRPIIYRVTLRALRDSRCPALGVRPWVRPRRAACASR